MIVIWDIKRGKQICLSKQYKKNCISLGATTINDLIQSKEITNLTSKQCEKITAKKPDVLVLNQNKEVVVFMEMKTTTEFSTNVHFKLILNIVYNFPFMRTVKIWN